MSDEPLSKELCQLSRRYHLAAVYAFGSRAMDALLLVKGEAGSLEESGSDLDLGILPSFDHPLNAKDRVQMTLDFETLFRVNRVDLVVLPEASAFLALEVVRGELLYTADPVQEAEYQLFVLRRAGDLAHWERERRRMLRDGEAV